MICVSVAEQSLEMCVNALQGIDFAEICLDTFDQVSLEDMRMLFSIPERAIAICRPERCTNQEMLRRLLMAMDVGAQFIDIDLEAPDEIKESVIKKAKEVGVQVIVSFHNYQRTPQQAELEHVISWCFDSGADIAKIACHVNDDRDNARLLGLLNIRKKLIIIGMGDKGKITRLASPVMGGFCSYSSCCKGKETAKGQLPFKDTQEIVEALRGFVS
jgi:3-dehydroquinate dehydratase I